MAETIQMTNEQALKLEIFRLVDHDTTAAEKAIEFVAASHLNFELFKDGYSKALVEPTPVARTEKSIREAKQALDLFTPGA